jgi:uncharacterized repeat protein (TIGR02543 family)
MFDFNQDGKQEIVYRDEQTLRIIDGSTSTPSVLATIENLSGTSAEYPVVADVDGDGHAEITIVGGISSDAGQVYWKGRLWVYRSAGTYNTWASARKVWNQYYYHPTQVSEDLSIPRYPMSPATVFPGPDNKQGTPDDVRPYNNFWQQQTEISVQGTPVWPLPSPQTDSMFRFYDAVKDTMFITVDVVNTGDAPFQTPFHITVYKDAPGNATKYTYAWQQQPIAKDDTARITFGIPNYLASWSDAAELHVRLNDAGDTISDQQVCDSLLRDVSGGPMLLAISDRAVTASDLPVMIPALANDSIPAGCTPTPEVTVPPASGTTVIFGDSIRYTPVSGFTGRDTFTYRIACDRDTSTACVYVYAAETPDNILLGSDCYLKETPQITWSFREMMNSSGTGVFVDNSCIPLVGDMDNDGKTEIVVLAKGQWAQYTDSIHIFEVDDDTLRVQQTIGTPVLNRINNPYAIARVDEDNYAALFFCTAHYAADTSTSTATNEDDARQLMKYRYNNVSGKYEFAWKKTYSVQINREMGQPVIVDFNNDGIAEALVLDKVFNARTGALLVDGGHLSNSDNGFGFGGHLITINRWVNGSDTTWSSIMAVGDIDGDAIPEVIGGKTVYRVNINNPTTQDGTNTFTVLRHVSTDGHPEAVDGPTAIADMDGDGLLDAIVTGNLKENIKSSLYIWNPRTGEIMHDNIVDTIPISRKNEHSASVPFIGDIDRDGQPEICLSGKYVAKAYDFDAPARMLTRKWSRRTTDESTATVMTMFDFDQDGAQEIVYRDIDSLYIFNGDGSYKIPPMKCPSATGNEYPVIADVNGDHSAEIVVTSGRDGKGKETEGALRVFAGATVDSKWAPTRKVWNQFAYNAVNVNEDLTIPRYPLNPATVFMGKDDSIGTSDDERPYNGYLMQQTTLLGIIGTPIWPTPDAVFDDGTQISMTSVGDSISVTVCITNTGDAPLGSPVYVTLYRDSIRHDPARIVKTDSLAGYILPGETACLTTGVRDIRPYLPFVKLLVSINDNGEMYPVQPECPEGTGDSVRAKPNPALHLMMEKHATLRGDDMTPFVHDGWYANPVSVLYGDTVEYRITAANTMADRVTVRDTLPLYLEYDATFAAATSLTVEAENLSLTPLDPSRPDVVSWTLSGFDKSTPDGTVTFRATPAAGANASQPLYVNRAWVDVIVGTDTISVPTANRTYHQGAGTSVVTFSAGRGGSICNADPQAVDYSTTAGAGVLIAADEGYEFAGWRHDAYTSYRGREIPARSGIMHYDTLAIYGNVELRADFRPNLYPIRYCLNGAENDSVNPADYTVQSAAITLAPPRKPGDVFTGWTGSNGDDPQETVIIPAGSTGDRAYYANFLYSGREAYAAEETTDKIWAAGNEAYIRTFRSGSIVSIYTPDGVLHRQHTILATGITKLRLAPGVYIVTLNGGIGQKIFITEN